MTFCIPDGIEFSDLGLVRESDGDITYDHAVMETICHANGFSIELFTHCPGNNLAKFINSWYLKHLRDGGQPDPVQELLIEEVRIQDAAGRLFSHKPGRA